MQHWPSELEHVPEPFGSSYTSCLETAKALLCLFCEQAAKITTGILRINCLSIIKLDTMAAQRKRVMSRKEPNSPRNSLEITLGTEGLDDGEGGVAATDTSCLRTNS